MIYFMVGLHLLSLHSVIRIVLQSRFELLMALENSNHLYLQLCFQKSSNLDELCVNGLQNYLHDLLLVDELYLNDLYFNGLHLYDFYTYDHDLYHNHDFHYVHFIYQNYLIIHLFVLHNHFQNHLVVHLAHQHVCLHVILAFHDEFN